MKTRPLCSRRIFPFGSLLRRTLRRRGVEVAVRSILLAGIVLATGFAITSSSYEASLLMWVEAEPDASGRPTPITAATLQTLAQLASSRNVLDEAAGDASLAEMPWFRRAVRAERVPGVPMIRVAAWGTPDQAPRIADAVVAAFERSLARSSAGAKGEVRDQAEARLVGLRVRSEEIERTWRDFARRKADGDLGRRLDEVDLHELAAERVAVRLEIADAERQRAEPHPSGYERVRRLSSAAVSPLPLGMAWFWLAAGLVPVAAPAGLLGLAMVAEARRARSEAREAREVDRQGVPSHSPLLIAIQLSHGDWRTHPSP